MPKERPSVTPPSSRSGAVRVPTVVPPFDPSEYARDSESMTVATAARVSDVPTIPPDSDYADLRESCSTNMRAAAPAPIPRELTDEETHRRATRAFVTPLAAVPVLLVAREDCAWFDLGADASALLHAVDEVTPLVALAESCGISPARALEIVGHLVKERILELLPPA